MTEGAAKQVKAIVIAITAYIVSFILSYISRRAAESDTDSLDDFTMRPAKEISTIGWIGAAFFLFCIIGSSIANQFEGMLIVIFGGLFFDGVFLILVPVKGFWEVTVKGNKVTRRLFWLLTKTFNISDINRCVYTGGEYKVYIKGRKRKAFGIDDLFINTENWEKRMEIEGVKVEMLNDADAATERKRRILRFIGILVTVAIVIAVLFMAELLL